MTLPATAELVSVVIPCHNYAHFVGNAIESVLKQSYPNVEIIVIDDGSTDDTKDTIMAYRSVHYVRQHNLGVSRARNIGLSSSRGAYVLFLDADDCLLPGAIEVGVNALGGRKDCAFVFGLCVMVGLGEGLKDLPRDQDHTYEEMLKRNFIINPGQVLYHRWVFEHVGGFDESNGPAADYDLYLRMTRQFPILCHYHTVVEYRRHDNNMSNDPRVMLQASLAVLARQRKHVTTNPVLVEAYTKGRHYYQGYFGEALVERIHTNLVRAQWGSVARDAYTLMKCFPTRFTLSARRKMAKLIDALKSTLF